MVMSSRCIQPSFVPEIKKSGILDRQLSTVLTQMATCAYPTKSLQGF